MGWGTNVVLKKSDPYGPLGRRQRRAGQRQGHRLGLRLLPPGRRHRRAVPGRGRHPARPRRSRCGSPTARTSSSGASPRSSCPTSTPGLDALGMAEPGAELARDVVACPGADTCNLAVTQSRGLAGEIGAGPGGGRPGRRRRRAGQHLRLHQLLRPAPHLRHRLHGRRAPGPRPGRPRLPDAARRLRRPHPDRVRPQGPAPAGQGRRRGHRPGRRPLRRRAVGRRELHRLARAGGRRLRPWPPAWPTSTSSPRPTENPDFYVDYDETGPYIAEVGAGECAAG